MKRFCTLLLLTSLAGCNQGPTATVNMATALSLLAGSPTAGNSGGSDVDDSGVHAQFTGIVAITSDGTNSYVLENAGHGTGVRQVALSSGQVTTLTSDLFGDGGQSGWALFAAQSIISDGQGSLYVPGGSNLTRIDVATKAITNIALPVPASADPTDYAFLGGTADAAGNLYLYAPRAIAEFTPATNQLTQVATLSDAINCLTADVDGHLYATVSGHNTIAQIDVADGTVTTLAGADLATGYDDGVGVAATFTAPHGLVYGAGQLYVADNDRLRQIDLATSRVTTPPGTEGLVPLPYGLDVTTQSWNASLTMAGSHVAVADTKDNVVLLAL